MKLSPVLRRLASLALVLPAAATCVLPSAEAIQPPSGYAANTFAGKLVSPASFAFGPDGRLYVCTPNWPLGKVPAMQDLNGDGIADTKATYAQDLERPLGVAHLAGDVFGSLRRKVVRFRDVDADHVADTADPVLSGIPGDTHRNNDLTAGPDGHLYIACYGEAAVCRVPPGLYLVRTRGGGATGVGRVLVLD